MATLTSKIRGILRVARRRKLGGSCALGRDAGPPWGRTVKRRCRARLTEPKGTCCPRFSGPGTSPSLIAGLVSGTDRESLLRFDLSQIPSGATVTSAVVTLNESVSPTGPSELETHRILLPWNEQTVTWQSFYAPGAVGVAYDAQIEASAANMLPNQYSPMPVQFSLVPLAQSWVNNPPTNHGVLLLQPSPPPGGWMATISTDRPKSAGQGRYTEAPTPA